MKAIDLIGRRFGRLVVIARAASLNKNSRWVCLCDCGVTTTVGRNNLISAHTRSCGCLQSESRLTATLIHGESSPPTPEWTAWVGMLTRCYNPHVKGYHNYGGRNIIVCPQWKASFESFLADMGWRPSGLYSLDRYPDNDGNYEPGNVRWATIEEQASNRRTNILITIEDVTKTLKQWADYFNLSYKAIYQRFTSGCPVSRLFDPIRRSPYPKGVQYRAGLTKPWSAKIRIGGVVKHLGYFHTQQEVATAYQEARQC